MERVLRATSEASSATMAVSNGPTRRVVTSPLTTPVRRIGSRSNEPQTLLISASRISTGTGLCPGVISDCIVPSPALAESLFSQKLSHHSP